MNRWAIFALNAVLLGLVLATIPLIRQTNKPNEANSQGVDALNDGRYDEAIQHISEAVEMSPENRTFKSNLLAAYISKAINSSEKGDSAAALATYEEALKMAPEDQVLLKNYISALNNLGVEESNNRSFVKAQQYFEKATTALFELDDAKVRDSIRHNYSELLTLWGTELMKRNQVTEARRALEQAITLNDANGVAYESLGDLAYEGNDYPSAAKHYLAALPINENNKNYLENRLQMIQDESELEGNFLQVNDGDNRFLLQYVKYNGGTTITQVLEMLNEAYDTIGDDLGVYPARRVNVKIYTQEDFARVAKLPEWAIGIFDGKMRLRVSEVQSAPALVRDLIFHEYTHAVLAMNIKQEVPAWFHEGIAQLMEPQFRENARELEQVRVALTRHQISFEQLEESFREISSKDTAENAYLLSKYFLTHLNRKYGHEKLQEWVTLLTKDVKFASAFKQTYQVDLGEAQKAWIDSQVSGG